MVSAQGSRGEGGQSWRGEGKKATFSGQTSEFQACTVEWSQDLLTIFVCRFLAWCRAAKIEPYIVVNMGTGTLEDALNWIEYCNGTGDT